MRSSDVLWISKSTPKVQAGRLVGIWKLRLLAHLLAPHGGPGEASPGTGLPGGATLWTAKSLLGLHLLSQSHQCVSVSGLCPSSLCFLLRLCLKAIVVAPVTEARSWQNYFPLCWASISQ